ncbi:thiamineS protein [Formosa agariphila KMM 3901]|uniref:ThiamineS protein n=1 Tax=Formosa agariphila (strain DSM 15362 / KCTC 12365 / LMG 23005 / KMM 3901 / M-2Alg 35-1) TaxID=1347342 RepID=T2KHP2_FORAG|nr:MoaD/ThiS family protein [Formosa agariphila]CDF78367.1 thiamineS protein [Formosa agariphila KMM 3901]
MITIKYFGMLAEQTQCSEEQLEFKPLTLSELVQDLKVKYQFNSASFHVALNHKLIQGSEEITLQFQDEIALLPPFAGG